MIHEVGILWLVLLADQV
eukprot:Gb_12276 [translate_table: standard]